MDAITNKYHFILDGKPVITNEFDVFSLKIQSEDTPAIIREFIAQGGKFTQYTSVEAAGSGAGVITAYAEVGGIFTNRQEEDNTRISESMYVARAGIESMKAYHAAGGRFSNKLRDREGTTDASWLLRNHRDNPEAIKTFIDLDGTFFDDNGEFLVDNTGTPVWMQEKVRDLARKETWKERFFEPEELKAFIIEYTRSRNMDAALKAARSVPLNVKFPPDPLRQFDAVHTDVDMIARIKKFKAEGREFTTEPDKDGSDCGMYVAGVNLYYVKFDDYLARMTVFVDEGGKFTDRKNWENKSAADFVKMHASHYRLSPQQKESIDEVLARGTIAPRDDGICAILMPVDPRKWNWDWVKLNRIKNKKPQP